MGEPLKATTSLEPAKKKLSDLAYTFKRQGGIGVGDYDKYWDARKEVSHLRRAVRHDRIVTELRNMIPKGGAILDSGVGPAHYYRSLTNDYEMYGVEISRSIIESYEFDTSRIAQCDLNHTFPHFGIQFDAVVSSMIFHHMDEPPQLARNIFGALKSTGLLIVVAPNIWHLKNRLRVLRGSSPRFSPSHRNFQTPKELTPLIEEVGFRLQKVLPGRPSQNGGLARLWPNLGASELILFFRKIETEKSVE